MQHGKIKIAKAKSVIQHATKITLFSPLGKLAGRAIYFADVYL